ncbi:MFS general substrate transporter [Coniophora puteana RWD-64-598 SS2]|uniref:MFS general substrate transporter n=1 Tax=Coniophora puteana (strain RWD-64-598) TaxID=741705 RepID=A0A5M3MGH9_CONPW|nr:MFS general substrate transporter [Coniophora puteana RWD-64-598 SS2]EIW77864.1 MFS general substrate transporter [Coniophora puteana RWD-64-598 SS2]
MQPPTPLSPTETLVESPAASKDVDAKPELSTSRKLVLLSIFCLAQFIDSFNNSALFSAIPALETQLGITESQSTWVMSAFQLTFASFLLISGRISDVYPPKHAFVAGIAGEGLLSIIAGFVNVKIPLIILRALIGISAALTIPSALTLLVNVFPEPHEQARAIGIFGGCGGVANVLGLIIGAFFVEYASWHWVFWFVAIVAIPVAVVGGIIIPPQEPKAEGLDQSAKWKSLDLIGVSALTTAIVLFIYAVTSGSTDGFANAGVLVPLIVAILLTIAFFLWERRIPPEKAAIPPRTWFYKNFSVLFGASLLPFFWWSTIFTMFMTLWQDVFDWSVISCAIHMFPIGVLAFAMSFTGPLAKRISPKWIIMTGLGMLIIATALLAIGGGKEELYWSYVFPAFILGSGGAQLSYSHTNIAIFRVAPSSMAGTVGAMFNGALQFGAAVGLAAVTSIEAAVEEKQGGPQEYHGRAASLWFLTALVCVEFLSLLTFYRTDAEKSGPSECDVEKSVEGKTSSEGEVTEQEKQDYGGDYFSSKKVQVDSQESV